MINETAIQDYIIGGNSPSAETSSLEEQSALNRTVQDVGPKSIADIPIKGTPTPDWVSPLINRSIDVVLYGSAFSALGASVVFMPALLPVIVLLFSIALGRNVLKMDIGQFREKLQNKLAQPAGKELKRFFKEEAIVARMLSQFQNHPKLKKHLNRMQEIAQKGDSCSVEDIRAFHKAYNAVARSKTFEDLKQNHPDNSLVLFMEELAFALYENVDLLPIYEEIGGVIIAPILEEFEQTDRDADRPFQKLAFVMERAMSDPGIPILRRDTLAQKLLWGFIFPEKIVESVNCHTQKEHYTEIDKTNVIGKGWVYNSGDQEITSLLGPGTLDPIAVLYFRAKDRKKQTVIHMNLQYDGIKGETERVQGLKEWDEASEYVHFVSYPMDGPNWKIPKERLGFKTAQEFYQSCADDPNFLTTTVDEGKDLKQRKMITDRAGTIFDGFISENLHWGAMNQERRGKMMQLFAGGLLFIGANEQQFQADGDNTTQKSPCKQEIDRGATMAVCGKILDAIAKGEDFNDEKLLRQLVGVWIARAYHTEGRMPLKDRYEPLLDFIHFISSFDSQQRAELQGQLNEFLAEYAPNS